jgi:dipeptide/tripeptide permease
MGIWFLSNSAGNILAGWAATFFSTMPLGTLFSYSAIATMAAGAVLLLLLKPVKGLMAGR